MITASQIRETIEWVDRSKVAPEIEALLRRTRRGRPRQLTVRALVIGIKLAIDETKTSCLTDVHQVLTEHLPPAVQENLGVRHRQTKQTVTLHQVRRLFAS